MTLTNDQQYRPVTIPGYTTDPINVLEAAVKKASFNGIKAENTTALAALLKAEIEGLVEGDFTATVTVNTPATVTNTASAFTATVTISHGYTSKTVTINGTVSLP